MTWIALGSYRGWTVKWETKDHRMFITKPGLFFSNNHDFRERPNDRTTAFAIAKSWIDAA